ncbi:hypothetical protein WL15_05095 [Burkholderia multivorans]|nr:hypothetical protein WL15_05095 [Burkholderia multivorans]
MVQSRGNVAPTCAVRGARAWRGSVSCYVAAVTRCAMSSAHGADCCGVRARRGSRRALRVSHRKRPPGASTWRTPRSLASISSPVCSYRNACPVITAASNGAPRGGCSGAVPRIAFGSARRCRSAAAPATA